MDAVALTVAEVAALAGVDESKVRKDLEYEVLRAKGARPRLGVDAAIYLRALKLLGLELTVDDRRRLFRVVSDALKLMSTPARVPFGEAFELKLGTIATDVAKTLKHFERWKTKLVTRDDILGGEPVFPSSRLAVRKIGAMLIKGVEAAEIREDYPYLSEEDLELAQVFTRAYPRMGRPREIASR